MVFISYYFYRNGRIKKVTSDPVFADFQEKWNHFSYTVIIPPIADCIAIGSKIFYQVLHI